MYDNHRDSVKLNEQKLKIVLSTIKLCLWYIGMVLTLFSRFIFQNNNEGLWKAAHYFNLAYILNPITLVICIVILIDKRKYLKNMILSVFILLLDFIYMAVWVACTGGV